jgi:hypothetical protein
LADRIDLDCGDFTAAIAAGKQGRCGILSPVLPGMGDRHVGHIDAYLFSTDKPGQALETAGEGAVDRAETRRLFVVAESVWPNSETNLKV